MGRPCAGSSAGNLRLELDGEAEESVKPVEGDVGDVPHVGGPPDLHRVETLVAAPLLRLAVPSGAMPATSSSSSSSSSSASLVCRRYSARWREIRRKGKDLGHRQCSGSAVPAREEDSGERVQESSRRR
ncbi:hypothetical protein BHM03_00007844 [Ensete ventricosum]|nr:hypothetical protein BHM03_00007844 [Ensete ventricosum]